MSIENETAVTEQEVILDQSEEVVSEQPESEEVQDVANPEQESEQVDETEEREALFQALSGEAEPEEDEGKSNVPRSTRRLQRKNKRLEKRIAEQSERIAALERARYNPVQPQIPQRDWDNETDEQYQVRLMQAVLEHKDGQQQAQTQFNQQRQTLIEQERQQTEAVQKYADEVDKLGFKDYDDIEAGVLNGMHEDSLAEMARIDPSATPKIMMYLNANPSVHKELADASNNDASKFYLLFGELRAKVNDIEKQVRNRKRQVSKAPGDTALDTVSGSNSIDAQMEKAANSGNFKLYRELKAKKYKQ